MLKLPQIAQVTQAHAMPVQLVEATIIVTQYWLRATGTAAATGTTQNFGMYHTDKVTHATSTALAAPLYIYRAFERRQSLSELQASW